MNNIADDSSRHRASDTVAGARKLRSLSTPAQQGSCYLFGLRGGIQPQSTCLPSLRPAPSDHPFAGGQPIGVARVSAQRLCPTCIKHPPHFFGAYAPYLMRTGMRDLIHLWKFQNRPQLTGLLAELLLSHLPTDSGDSLTHPGAAAHTSLVPIPTQWRRQMRRGFDHTWLLANAIPSQWAQPAAVSPWLKNRHYRPAQHRLNTQSRLADTQDRFIADPAIAGHNVALIDDVMTTGATARAAARACTEAGAHSVAAWCLARTPAPFAVE